MRDLQAVFFEFNEPTAGIIFFDVHLLFM